MSSLHTKTIIGLALPVGVYAVVIGALLTPYLQRFALYAHKFNTLFLHDVDEPEAFGFAKNQVTPFNITTPDGEVLYAWHILPNDVYQSNEDSLRGDTRPDGVVDDITKAIGFKLLTSPDQRVVVSFHGNAGHIAQNQRQELFRHLANQPNTHILTTDYRGFGKSTGSPTEAGLITDGTALVNWVLDVAQIESLNIVILGQSLGTAVASAVGLHFADPANHLLPDPTERSLKPEALHVEKPTTFAGIVLVAPFFSIPSLLLTYRIGGWLPLLLPLRPFPTLGRYVTSHVIDKWPTGERLAEYYSVVSNSPRWDPATDQPWRFGNQGSLQLFHALNDRDISFHQTEMICRKIVGPDEKCIDGTEGPQVLNVKKASQYPPLRFELLGYGGHNRIATFSPVAIGVLRAFEGIPPLDGTQP